MKSYLQLFESVIRQQTEAVGTETAHAQAGRAGLTISPEGRIVSFDGEPQLVLLRLIKCFTEGGSVAALMACRPLIERVLADLPVEQAKDA